MGHPGRLYPTWHILIPSLASQAFRLAPIPIVDSTLKGSCGRWRRGSSPAMLVSLRTGMEKYGGCMFARARVAGRVERERYTFRIGVSCGAARPWRRCRDPSTCKDCTTCLGRGHPDHPSPTSCLQHLSCPASLRILPASRLAPLANTDTRALRDAALRGCFIRDIPSSGLIAACACIPQREPANDIRGVYLLREITDKTVPVHTLPCQVESRRNALFSARRPPAISTIDFLRSRVTLREGRL